MPPLRADDKPTPAKPLMPTLAAKRNLKSPITPRLATQHVGAATPPLVKSSGRSTTPATVKSAVTRDELSTPAKTLMNSNVTPRSGSRKSRVDSNQSTPTGTPTSTRPQSYIEPVNGGVKHTPFAGFGLGIVGQANRSRPTSMVGGALSPSITSQPKFGRADEQIPADGPMFFHANDAQRSPELRPAQTRKSPVFVYANGQQDEHTRSASSQPSPPLSTVSTKSKRSQFFHADGRADADIPPVPALPSPSTMNAPPQFFQASPAFRPPSPAKDANFHLSYRKGASQIIRPPAVERPKTVSILPLTNSATADARKRSLSGPKMQAGPHNRTSSLSSIESAVSARRTSIAETGLTPLQTVMHAPSPVISETASAPVLSTMASPAADRTSLGTDSTSSISATRERQASPSSPILSLPQSPTKSQSSLQNQLAEVIMNARVERKVQDLEISNSSLMAINKSLEKEVRRQNRELRRFRRLSRAGRLSTASTMLSVGTNGDEDDFGGELSALDEVSEEEDEDEDEEDDPSESSDDSSSSDLASLSPEAIAEREERKLAKDSKRLQLDLAKHRDILVDSQKLNQSLRRCMAWTEMMIKDGKKALDYRVDTEVIGGRILDHDDLHAEREGDEGDEDEDEDNGPRHSLLSSWTPSPNPIPHLEALDGILGLDTSAITNGVSAGNSMPSALLDKGDFWSIANALP